MNTQVIKSLREKKVHTGSWISSGSPVITEMAAGCGFDWLLIDMEHGFGSEEGLLAQLMAFKGSSTAAIVRVGAPHPDLILRVLDRGADGIMIPHVSTVKEAEACVQAAYYPPHGRRGYSRSTRSHGYGLNLDSVSSPFILAQIETIEGVQNARAIAGVDGIDALFVGPADLNFDLRARPETADRSYPECLATVSAAVKEAGKQCGILLRNTEDFGPLSEQGYSWMALDSDLGILRCGYQRLVDRFKNRSVQP